MAELEQLRFAKHSNPTYMLELTGWERTYYAKANSGSTTNTKADFRNLGFCVTNPQAYVGYSTVSVTTSTTRSVSHLHKFTKSGGCSSWLDEQFGFETESS